MAIGTTTAAIISLASMGVGTAVSAVGAHQQAKAQKNQAEYQAAVAEQNQDMAEDQARALRQKGYEEGLKERQKAAMVIGKQRAIAGASGTQVDSGNFLDLNAETAERGAIDALAARQTAEDQARNAELQAWNYQSQAAGYQSQADSIDPGWAAGGTLIGGLAEIGAGMGSDMWGLGGGKEGTTLIGHRNGAGDKGITGPLKKGTPPTGFNTGKHIASVKRI